MMASRVGHVQKERPKRGCKNERPVSKPKRKKVSQDLSATEPTRTEESTVITRTRKVLNKKERKSLSDHLNSVDYDALVCAVNGKLAEQSLPDPLKEFADVLFHNEQLCRDILIHHRCRFVELFIECQKGVDSFLHFQLQWHQHCSAFLLSRSYPLSSIQLEKNAEASVAGLRNQWLGFYESNGISDLDSKKVMILISSAVYELLLERAEEFQKNLNHPQGSGASSASSSSLTDGDDVYIRFGGAALCDMLHQRYKSIKSCQNSQRDILSQEITVLQAINTKDKTKIPQYLRYRDRGFMYFPDISFIPFLRSLDEIVKEVINTDTVQEDDGIIQVCHL